MLQEQAEDLELNDLVPNVPNPTDGLLPYKDSGGKFLNARGVQIISAGKDLQFGKGGSNWGVNSEYDASGVGGDDLSNFADGTLAQLP